MQGKHLKERHGNVKRMQEVGKDAGRCRGFYNPWGRGAGQGVLFILGVPLCCDSPPGKVAPDG